MTAEHSPKREQTTRANVFGRLAVRLHEYLNPPMEELERRSWRRIEKRWSKYGRAGFTVIRSAEGSLSTPESVRGFRPADMTELDEEV